MVSQAVDECVSGYEFMWSHKVVGMCYCGLTRGVSVITKKWWNRWICIPAVSHEWVIKKWWNRWVCIPVVSHEWVIKK